MGAGGGMEKGLNPPESTGKEKCSFCVQLPVIWTEIHAEVVDDFNSKTC